jgi:integrase
MVGLAILSGLRRGELFALRWKDIDECARVLTVREAVYDGMFSTPKTEAGQRQIPLSAAALGFIGEWKERAGRTPDALVFATRTGNSISEQRPQASDFSRLRSVGPASRDVADLPSHLLAVVTRQGCARQGRRSAHGARHVDTTLNVYTQVLDGSLRAAVDRVGGELFTIVHQPEGPAAPIH